MARITPKANAGKKLINLLGSPEQPRTQKQGF